MVTLVMFIERKRQSDAVRKRRELSPAAPATLLAGATTSFGSAEVDAISPGQLTRRRCPQPEVREPSARLTPA